MKARPPSLVIVKAMPAQEIPARRKPTFAERALDVACAFRQAAILVAADKAP